MFVLSSGARKSFLTGESGIDEHLMLARFNPLCCLLFSCKPHWVCLCVQRENKQKTFFCQFLQSSSSSSSLSRSRKDALGQTAALCSIITTVMTAQQRSAGHHWTYSCMETLFPPPCCERHSAAGHLARLAECQLTPCCGICCQSCMLSN